MRRTSARALLVAAFALPLVLSGCNDTKPFGVGGSGVVRLESGLSDTVRQRSLSLFFSVFGADTSATVEAVIDAGTAAERRANVLNRCAQYFYLSAPRCTGDSTAWLFEFPDTLANGPHHLDVRFAAGSGERTYTAEFVTDVASVPYTLLALPGAGGTDSDALDVNASGQVAGWAKDAAGVSRAVTWQTGTVAVLPTSPTARSSLAVALNDAGDAVGGVVDTAGVDVCERGIRWSAGSWQYVLAPARSNTRSSQFNTIYCDQRVVDISTSGTMLIQAPSIAGGYNYQSWIDKRGTQTAMQSVDPAAVNNHDEVVGDRYSLDMVTSFYSPGITVIAPSVRLPDNFGHQFGRLISINNQSQILGAYSGTMFIATVPGKVATDLNPVLTRYVTLARVTDNGTVLAFDARINTAFLWRDRRTTRVSLTTPGWRLDRLAAMNDAGDIVGHATESATGRTSAVLLRRAP